MLVVHVKTGIGIKARYAEPDRQQIQAWGTDRGLEISTLAAPTDERTHRKKWLCRPCVPCTEHAHALFETEWTKLLQHEPVNKTPQTNSQIELWSSCTCLKLTIGNWSANVTGALVWHRKVLEGLLDIPNGKLEIYWRAPRSQGWELHSSRDQSGVH